ncbi:hybrid sensor histidine kinase/response regulator [Sneathiella chinensis]|uniref:histidine kinase n=1 Tax=Sneathiella chinensis TaxID=349750 RepID=A0ABQ5U136_9PROT|nr:ATP-binding protein [Sneathiella chinensis]GLQ05579.1 hypothetical protein GCM10007924_08000 [Sneathiella chinensis]
MKKTPDQNPTPSPDNQIEALQQEIATLKKNNRDLERELELVRLQGRLDRAPHVTGHALHRLTLENAFNLLQICPFPILVTGHPGGEVLFANDILCRGIQIKPEDLIGLNSHTFYKSQFEHDSLMVEVLANGYAFNKTIRFQINEHQMFDTVLFIQLMEIDGYSVAVSALMDITNHIEVQRQLRESEERHRLVVENAPEAIVLWNSSLKTVMTANKSAVDLFGYTHDDFLTIDLTNLSPEFQKGATKSSTLFRKYMRQALSGDIPVFEWEFLCKDGKKFLCEVRFIAYELNGVTFVQSSIIEIGEKRKLEAQLQRHQRLQVLGRLTGGIAHDFNNILAVISGHTELLEEKYRDEDAQTLRMLDKVLSASQRGGQLTQKLLAYSRNQPMMPKLIDTNREIRDLASILQSQLGPAISLVLKCEADTGPCRVDPVRLESVLLNLCLNAKDSMPGGGTLTITTGNVTLDDDYAAGEPDLTAGDYILITVTDTGEGIADADIDHVFDPFFTTEDFGQKSGMGLSMVFGFAKQSSGHVSIYSEIGHGTVVRLYLPRQGADQEAAEKAPLPSPRLHPQQTILLVEDNPDIRVLTLAMLRSMNYTVLEAASGETALAILSATTGINLLITDFILEGDMNGEDIASAARKQDPDLPVLYISGYPRDVLENHATLDADATVLQKPFRKNDLSDKILETLSKATLMPRRT